VNSIEVDATTARRFVLGRQGLWPGRRWRGLEGVHAAIHEVGAIQIDPLDVVGRSHDLALASRVDGYRPALLARALYDQRLLFEWGGTLQVRPIEELPFMLRRMRAADYQGRRARFERSHRSLIQSLLKEVESRGPLTSRELPVGTRVSSYRARRDTGLALYYLWLRGDLMIHSRVRGERRYDLTSRLISRRLLVPAPEAEARQRNFRRAVRAFGLPNASELGVSMRTAGSVPVKAQELQAWIAREERSGRLKRVQIEGWRGRHWVDAPGEQILDGLRRGDVPREWHPLNVTTEEEATFLAPLEIVSARGRSKRLFDFDYVWEVYKPAPKRRWGYYTLPILHGERLRARTDLKYDRDARTLRILGFWFESEEASRDQHFAEAVGRGLTRLRQMTGAERVDLTPIKPSSFRGWVSSAIRA
jgi:hypothetical protein